MYGILKWKRCRNLLYIAKLLLSAGLVALKADLVVKTADAF